MLLGLFVLYLLFFTGLLLGVYESMVLRPTPVIVPVEYGSYLNSLLNAGGMGVSNSMREPVMGW